MRAITTARRRSIATGRPVDRGGAEGRRRSRGPPAVRRGGSRRPPALLGTLLGGDAGVEELRPSVEGERDVAGEFDHRADVCRLAADAAEGFKGGVFVRGEHHADFDRGNGEPLDVFAGVLDVRRASVLVVDLRHAAGLRWRRG